jgi:malto-oligosyltrehalose trehalohydrolase
MQFGATLRDTGAEFRIWAPSVPEVKLVLYGENGGERIVTMDRVEDAWFTATVDGVKHGQRYHYLVNDLRVPDPASRQQAGDVHGPSVLIDPARFEWTDNEWRGKPWEETVLYELHVGTFTREGTFRSVIEKLDYLKSLGITAIELMPISDFPGDRNWGYDGVLHFAPDSTYGTPDDLKALVNAAHEKGMMMFLDVVYNHFGPEGNYLYVHSKPFFTEKYKTPWGAAIDFEGEQSATVRRFFFDNAIYWLDEFHFDGLRFDAVHAIYDESEKTFLKELAETVKKGIGRERRVHLVLENDDNNADLLEYDNTLPRHFTAQWNDDFHHCAHVIATGEESGYYADYAKETSFSSAVEHFARVLAEGFAYQGDRSEYRNGEPRGMKSGHLPATAFVSFMQNHDQIGNRAFGDRIAKLTTPEKLRALTAITLLSPQIPMLFMGEEWASQTPFCFFCDFGPELAPSVKEGRRQEFAKFPEFKDEKKRDMIPDPTSEQTFVLSILDWSELENQNNASHFEFVRTLLQIRAAQIAPRLPGIRGNASWDKLGENAFQVRWQLADGELILTANLGDTAVNPAQKAESGAKIVFSTHTSQDGNGSELRPWCVIWQIKDAKQG